MKRNFEIVTRNCTLRGVAELWVTPSTGQIVIEADCMVKSIHPAEGDMTLREGHEDWFTIADRIATEKIDILGIL